MFAPFFASQIPFITFLKEQLTLAEVKVDKEKASRNTNCCIRILSYISIGWFKLVCFSMVTPLMLVLMAVMDLVFLFNSVVLTPIIYLLGLLMCGFVDLNWLLSFIDEMYMAMFKMQRIDAAGFRRMRTITQLTFETMIQLVLQVRMLIYYNNNKYGDLAHERIQ